MERFELSDAVKLGFKLPSTDRYDADQILDLSILDHLDLLDLNLSSTEVDGVNEVHAHELLAITCLKALTDCNFDEYKSDKPAILKYARKN